MVKAHVISGDHGLAIDGSRIDDGRGFGFEGGCVLMVGDHLHLFTAELLGPVLWVKTRLAHWVSTDGRAWIRAGTIMESSGDHTGSDPRASMFSPMPVYDEAVGAWQFFYVTYRSQPNTADRFLNNYEGRVVRARSMVQGPAGIEGPYQDEAIVLEPGAESATWEGLQGADSFFPFRRPDGTWLAFYGSAETQVLPIRRWAVGLAEAPDLSGPWRRRYDLGALGIEPVFVENPVVSRLGDLLVAVYDNGEHRPRGFGLTTSHDGVSWTPGVRLDIPPSVAPWAKLVRTPLGILPVGDDVFRVYFTAYDKEGTGAAGGVPKDATASVGYVTISLSQIASVKTAFSPDP